MKKVFLLILAVWMSAAAGCWDANAQNPGQRSNNIVFVDGNDFYLHSVASGETLYSISKLYGVSVDEILANNSGLTVQSLQAGNIIKVICRDIPETRMSDRKLARTFTEHKVVAGDTVYSIAKRYGISVNTIIEDNPGIDPAVLSTGTLLKIRKKDIGATDTEDIKSEINRYASALNEVSDDYMFYVVRQGDTLYSLSKAFNVEIEELTRINNLTEDLKAGSILKIPSGEPGRRTVDSLDNINGLDLTVCNINDPFAPLADFEYRGNMNIALLLPFSDGGDTASGNFVDFYRGALLAMETFKEAGYSLNVNVYNTQRNITCINDIIQNPEFRDSDLIIGPVYEESLNPVIEFARGKAIPLVSPLAVINGDYGSSLFQMAPAPGYRYDKLQQMFTPDKNIIFITSSNDDREFTTDMQRLAEGKSVQTINFSNEKQAMIDLDRVLSDTYTNLFVIPALDETNISKILASISSIMDKNRGRSKKTAPIEVIGIPRWTRYSSLSHNLFFKLNVTYVTSYFADRSDAKVNQFYRRYISTYSKLPTPYSFRGYDAVRIFGEGMMLNTNQPLTERLNTITPLQVGYRFDVDDNGNNINIDWPLVRYKSDFTIEVM